MKLFLLLWLLMPVAAFTQKVKMNEYDKFIKQRRIEVEPIPVLSTPSADISLAYQCIGSTFYVVLSGFGWGAATISEEDQLIFLLSNDSTITVKSTGLQVFSITEVHKGYKHQYFITASDIETLSRYNLAGIRKYSAGEYTDLQVSGPYAGNVKRLSAMFLEELKKGKVLLTLRDINVTDIAKHIGDSVRFCSRVFSTQRYFDSSASIPTVLNVGAKYPNQLLTAVISKQDRENFKEAPELLYDNKDICISGVVQLYKDKPQIIVHTRDQISVKTPISLTEISRYIGDSVTVYGKVVTGKYFSDREDAPMILNMGTDYPKQLLTVVIEGVDRRSLAGQPENYYLNKEINITGKLILFNGKPQITVHNKNQLAVLSAPPVASGSAAVQPVTKLVYYNRDAEFPGGPQGWRAFLVKNLVVPGDELDYGERKTVLADISISTDGSLNGVKITQSAGRNFDNEVIRVLKKMPKWIPKIEDGKPAAVTLTVPITFNRESLPQ